MMCRYGQSQGDNRARFSPLPTTLTSNTMLLVYVFEYTSSCFTVYHNTAPEGWWQVILLQLVHPNSS